MPDTRSESKQVPEGGECAATRRRSYCILPIGTLLVGLMMNFHQMFLSRLAITHDGLRDARLVHYSLEHGFRFLRRDPLHLSLWNPPLFYPSHNAAAYTDLMFGFGPFYWLWRSAGISEETSLQLWLIAVFSINFVVSYLVLRSCAQASRLGACSGAFFIAFAQRNWDRVQQLPLFYVMLGFLAVYKLVKLIDRPGAPKEKTRKSLWWIALFFVAFGLQTYGAVYPSFFFGLYLLVAALVALSTNPSRDFLRALAGDFWRPVLICAVASLIFLAPLAHHYLATYVELGGRGYDPEKLMHPLTLIQMSPNWLYGSWMDPLRAFGTQPFQGAGFLTTAVAIYGIYKNWHRRSVRIIVLSAVLVLALAAKFGSFSLWYWMHAYFPGAQAIRSVWRIAMITFIPISLGLAYGVTKLQRNRGSLMALLLVVLCMAEQYHFRGGTDKALLRSHVEELARKVEPDCEAFFVLCNQSRCEYLTEDAEWAALFASVPTINGRYGNTPPGWRLLRLRNFAHTNRNSGSAETRVRGWMKQNGRSMEKVCLIGHAGLDSHAVWID